MIIFEEELKKFHKSLEMPDAESDIYSKLETADVLDVILGIASAPAGYDENLDE
ncbi:MAG: hypothetical protein K5987_08275 [Lachnospiraceae bacterium]|jgi:hypothetical protein|nr:hypothetical protein [Lachnospiraceae bacterium]MCR4938134.1 hypothetical protein [Lachnospiraceae bacterium]